MGDISDGIIDGTFCQYCTCILTKISEDKKGNWIGYGYPVSCLDCADINDEWWTVDFQNPSFKKYAKKKNFNLLNMGKA